MCLIKVANRIAIEDTGIGMEKDTLKGLFAYDNTHKAEGKYNQSDAGIGLMITI